MQALSNGDLTDTERLDGLQKAHSRSKRSKDSDPCGCGDFAVKPQPEGSQHLIRIRDQAASDTATFHKELRGVQRDLQQYLSDALAQDPTEAEQLLAQTRASGLSKVKEATALLEELVDPNNSTLFSDILQAERTGAQASQVLDSKEKRKAEFQNIRHKRAEARFDAVQASSQSILSQCKRPSHLKDILSKRAEADGLRVRAERCASVRKVLTTTVDKMAAYQQAQEAQLKQAEDKRRSQSVERAQKHKELVQVLQSLKKVAQEYADADIAVQGQEVAIKILRDAIACTKTEVEARGGPRKLARSASGWRSKGRPRFAKRSMPMRRSL